MYSLFGKKKSNKKSISSRSQENTDVVIDEEMPYNTKIKKSDNELNINDQSDMKRRLMEKHMKEFKKVKEQRREKKTNNQNYFSYNNPSVINSSKPKQKTKKSKKRKSVNSNNNPKKKIKLNTSSSSTKPSRSSSKLSRRSSSSSKFINESPYNLHNWQFIQKEEVPENHNYQKVNSNIKIPKKKKKKFVNKYLSKLTKKIKKIF